MSPLKGKIRVRELKEKGSYASAKPLLLSLGWKLRHGDEATGHSFGRPGKGERGSGQAEDELWRNHWGSGGQTFTNENSVGPIDRGERRGLNPRSA